MTKRKRTPSPSPGPRTRVVFEVPPSLLRFQAIARELARQSELLLQQAANSRDQQSTESQRLAPGALHFDAQAFQNNALRFSPFSHQSFLPSQPWPQTVKTVPTSIDISSNAKASSAPATSRDQARPQEGHARQISVGPDDQLFDELNDALHAEEDEGGLVSGPQPQYLTGGNRITFDPGFSSDWNGMRPEQYQPFMQSFPEMTTTHTSQPHFSSTLAHHPPRLSSNSFLPSSSANQAPSFYNPKSPPPPPAPPQNGAQSKSNMPGYYKSSLKLWSQDDQGAPPLSSSSQSTHQFGSVNSAYPQVPSYPGSATYPAPPPLASSPVTAFTNYGNSR